MITLGTLVEKLCPTQECPEFFSSCYRGKHVSILLIREVHKRSAHGEVLFTGTWRLACWGVTEQSEDSDLGVTGLGVGGEGKQSSDEGAKMFYLNFILIEASSCGC